MAIIKMVQTEEELKGLKALQNANLRRLIGEEEAMKEGFVTSEYSFELLQKRSNFALCEAVDILEKTNEDIRNCLIEGAGQFIQDQIMKCRDELVMQLGYRMVIARRNNQPINFERN